MAFFSSTVPKYYHNRHTNDHQFMTCIVRVNTQSQWQRTVTKVLHKCSGVHSFRMDDNGVIEIAGTVDPCVVLKMLGRAGRSAELCWFQFGQCSSNLFMQSSSRDGRFLHATNLCRPRRPWSSSNHHYYSYGDELELGHYYGTDHYRNSSGDGDQCYSYGNQQANYYPQSHQHIPRTTGEDFVCCTIM